MDIDELIDSVIVYGQDSSYGETFSELISDPSNKHLEDVYTSRLEMLEKIDCEDPDYQEGLKEALKGLPHDDDIDVGVAITKEYQLNYLRKQGKIQPLIQPSKTK